MHTLSAQELNNKFIKGEVTAKAITTSGLSRITEVDPKIGAFLSIFSERALKKADELDAKRASGKTLGKMAGIPIAIKDNIHVKGEISTCGSKFLTNYRAPFDSTVVRL